MTERRDRTKRDGGGGGAGGRAKPPVEPSRSFPELSRHLRGSDSVYSPDSADWLRQPPSRTRSAAKTENGGSGKTPPPRVPPKRNGRKRSEPPSRRSRLKVGGLLLICLTLLGIGVQQMTVGGGTPSPTPTLGPVIEPPANASPNGLDVPTETPTLTAVPTETEVPTPSPTPAPTATPDPRFADKIVCLDPGHGGSDRGAQRKANENAPEMVEAQYTLLWARAVRLRLESHGFTVVMTRNDDVDVNATGRDVNRDGETGKNIKDATKAQRAKMVDELQARINVCNKAKASVLISLHINYFDDPKAVGYETWYSGVRNDADASKLFAEYMEQEIGKQYEAAGYEARSRGANDDSKADANLGHGTFQHYLVIGPAQQGKVTPSEMPGIIVEVGFMSNDDEAAFMMSPEGRNAIVTAYEQATVRYFDKTIEDFVYGAK